MAPAAVVLEHAKTHPPALPIRMHSAALHAITTHLHLLRGGRTLRCYWQQITMAADNGGSSNAGGLFRLAAVCDELSSRYRGIRALKSNIPHGSSSGRLRRADPSLTLCHCLLWSMFSDASNLSEQPSASSKRRLRASTAARRHEGSLAIQSVAVMAGHIAVAMQHGRLLAVFDAVPSHLHFSSPDLHSLHTFLHSPPSAETEPFAHMLALHTADSAIVHMQFLIPTIALSSDPSSLPVRFLSVQSDASFLLWQYSSSECVWSFISRGTLPTAQQRHNRCVTAAVHCSSHNALLWCESYKGKTFMFRASLPALAATQIAELTTAESAAVIPLTLSADTTVSLLATQHGLLIRGRDSAICHYYHLATQHLTRLPQPASSTNSCLYHVHAITAQALCMSTDGAVYRLLETEDIHPFSALLSVPLAQWQQTAQLSPSADDDDEYPLFPLPPSSLFFAFQQTLCIVTPIKQPNGSAHSATAVAAASLFSFFTLPGGVFVDRFHSPLSPSAVNPQTAALGFGGSGVVLSTADELHCVVTPSVAALLAHLTAVSPHSDYLRRIEDDGGLVPSETFASASHSSVFPPLQPYLSEPSLSSLASASNSPLPSLHRTLSPPASLLIPSLPYPYLSHVASQLATGYGTSLSAQHEQFLIDRWLGCVTAASDADILPAYITSQHAVEVDEAADMEKSRDACLVLSVGLSKDAILQQAASCLQAPALPAAMTLLPSLPHYQHGHKYDHQQEAVVKHELDTWLKRMDRQRAETATQRDTNGKEAGPANGTDKEADYRTPLNESLLPLLSSLRASIEQINSVPASGSTAKAADLSALPSLLALPPLIPLSTQLSRAMANRSSSSSHLPTHDPSLATLAISHPTATFTYLRSLLGFDQLAPLSITDRQKGVHPNLLLLNDEIRLKKELGVWGKDVPINSASLQRGDGMPCFELMCRLYDTVQPERLSAFVWVMQREAGGSEASEVSGVRRWQRAVADRATGPYCERALRCLPPLTVGESQADERLDERVAARCWLLQESGRLTDAVSLRLSIARQLHTTSTDGKLCQHQEEAAIGLAYQVSPECVTVTVSDGLSAEEEEDEMDALRAALYHRITSYLFERALSEVDVRQALNSHDAESSEDEHDVRLMERVLAELDGRVKSLRHPHFSAQHLSVMLGQPLHADEDEDEDEEDERE